jgi:hypothetical protein
LSWLRSLPRNSSGHIGGHREAYYPGGPANVPQGLASPSDRYRRHAWVATAGLLFFILVYFGFAGWLARTAWRVLSGLANAGDEFLLSLVAGASAARVSQPLVRDDVQ